MTHAEQHAVPPHARLQLRSQEEAEAAAATPENALCPPTTVFCATFESLKSCVLFDFRKKMWK